MCSVNNYLGSWAVERNIDSISFLGTKRAQRSLTRKGWAFSFVPWRPSWRAKTERPTQLRGKKEKEMFVTKSGGWNKLINKAIRQYLHTLIEKRVSEKAKTFNSKLQFFSVEFFVSWRAIWPCCYSATTKNIFVYEIYRSFPNESFTRYKCV